MDKEPDNNTNADKETVPDMAPSGDTPVENLNKDALAEVDAEIAAETAEIAADDQDIKNIDKKLAEESDESYEDELMAELNSGSDAEEKQEAPPAAEVEEQPDESEDAAEEDVALSTHIFAIRTTANREDQVMDFLTSNAEKKGFQVYSIIRAHGMRGYIFVEAGSRSEAEIAVQGVPYARGLLPKEIEYKEIEHMLEQVKRDVNIKQNDIVEIISGPFKRENAKVIRVDKAKEEVVVGLLEAAVPIPITLKLDAVKVIRRDGAESDDE